MHCTTPQPRRLAFKQRIRQTTHAPGADPTRTAGAAATSSAGQAPTPGPLRPATWCCRRRRPCRPCRCWSASRRARCRRRPGSRRCRLRRSHYPPPRRRAPQGRHPPQRPAPHQARRALRARRAPRRAAAMAAAQAARCRPNRCPSTRRWRCRCRMWCHLRPSSLGHPSGPALRQVCELTRCKRSNSSDHSHRPHGGDARAAPAPSRCSAAPRGPARRVRERAGGAARARPPGLGRLRGAQAPAPRYFQTALSSEPRQKRLLRRSTHSWVAPTPFRVAARARLP
jgi:hypothetical protein